MTEEIKVLPELQGEIPTVVCTAPERVYLVIGDECPDDVQFSECDEVPWSSESVFRNDFEYVRADLAAAAQAQPAVDTAMKGAA